MHTLGTLREPLVRDSSLRSQRVVGRGAPRAMTKLRYEVLAIFGPTASGKSAVAAGSPHAGHRGRLRRCAPGLSRPRDSHEPALGADPPRRDSRSRRDDVGRRVRASRARRHRRARRMPTASRSSPAAPASTFARLSQTWTSLRPALRRSEPSSRCCTTPTRRRAYERLAALDPVAAETIHVNDRRRVVRALELVESGSSLAPASDRLWSEDVAALRSSSASTCRPELERRIAARTDGDDRAAGSSRRRTRQGSEHRRRQPRRLSASRSSRRFRSTRRERASSSARAATPHTSESGCDASRGSS